MILKGEILGLATEWQLTPGVVEKDYVLGWLLAAVAAHSATSELWVFKGGTCLKKCILETYRFSEDLDFSLRPGAVYNVDELSGILGELAAWVRERSGIEFPATATSVKPRKNLAGKETFEASMGYRGPLAQPGPPKIRFDLTIHEPIISEVVRRRIFHPYSDGLPPGTEVTTYSTHELVAEKTRALMERTRPRDLYDVIQLGNVRMSTEDAVVLRSIAARKFSTKSLELPSVAALARMANDADELKSEWANMLGHQLPALPPLEDYLERLPTAVAWLDGTPVRTPQPPTLSATTDETVLRERAITAWRSNVPIEAMRFAGVSHQLIEFDYKGHRRRVEPYSLRQPKTGNLLLYGWEVSKSGMATNAIRSYKVAEILEARVLPVSFRPRYMIEFTDSRGVWE